MANPGRNRWIRANHSHEIEECSMIRGSKMLYSVCMTAVAMRCITSAIYFSHWPQHNPTWFQCLACTDRGQSIAVISFCPSSFPKREILPTLPDRVSVTSTDTKPDPALALSRGFPSWDLTVPAIFPFGTSLQQWMLLYYQRQAYAGRSNSMQ